MKTYVARRLLALIPVGLVVATVAFMLTLHEFSEWLLARPDQKTRGENAPA